MYNNVYHHEILESSHHHVGASVVSECTPRRALLVAVLLYIKVANVICQTSDVDPCRRHAVCHITQLTHYR